MEFERRQSKVIRASVLGFDKVEFMSHALEQMKIRNITEDHVLQALREPEDELPTQPGRIRVRKSISPYRFVDVVYIKEKDRIGVITTISIQKEKPKPLVRRKRR